MNDKILNIETDKKYSLQEFLKYLINNDESIPNFLPKINAIKDRTIDVETMMQIVTAVSNEEETTNICYELGYIAGCCKKMSKAAKNLNTAISKYLSFLYSMRDDECSKAYVQVRNALLKDALMEFGLAYYKLNNFIKSDLVFHEMYKEYYESIEKPAGDISQDNKK